MRLSTWLQRVRAVYECRWAEGRAGRPRYDPGDYETWTWQALAEHGVDPLDDPRELIRAEHFRLWRARGGTPLRCGCCADEDILVPWLEDPRERGTVLHHERGHAWLYRRGTSDATEADAILFGGELALPTRIALRLLGRPDPLATAIMLQPHVLPELLALRLEHVSLALSAA